MTKKEFCIQEALGTHYELIIFFYGEKIRRHHEIHVGEEIEEKIKFKNCDNDWITIPLHIKINSLEYFSFIKSRLQD